MNLGTIWLGIRGDTKPVRKDLDNLKRTAVTDAVAIEKKTNSALSSMAKYWKLYALAATAALGILAKKAISGFATWESALVDMGKVTKESFASITRRIRELPPELGSATDLVKGYYQVISAGVTKPVRAINLLTQASRMAKAAHVDQSEVIKGLTKVMAGYEGEIKNVSDAADLLFTIEKEGQTSVAELIPVIGGLAKVSHEAAVSSNEMGAALAVITKTAGSTSEAATYYQAVVVSLMRSQEKMAEAVKELGYSSAIAMVQELGLVETLKQLQGTSVAAKEGLMKLYGRQEAMIGASALLAEKGAVFNKTLDAMKEKTGASAKAWEDYKRTLNGIWDTFKNTVGNQLVMIGEKLAPAIKEVVEKTGEWLRKNEEFITQGIGAVIQAIVNVFEFWLPLLKEVVDYWAKFFKIADENRAPMVSTVDDIKEKIIALNKETAGLLKAQKEINELIAGGVVPATAYTTMLAEMAEKIKANEALVGKYEKALKRLVKVKIDVTGSTEDNTDAWNESAAAALKEEGAIKKSIETHDELFNLVFLGLDRAAKKWSDFSDEAIAAALKTEKESGGSFNNLYGMMFAGMDQAAKEWEDSMDDIEKAAEKTSKGMMESFKKSARNIANSVKDTLGTVWSVVSNIWGRIKSMAGMFTGAITFFIKFPGDLKEAMERFTDSIADFPEVVDEFLKAVDVFVANLPKIITTFISSLGKFITGLVKAMPKVMDAFIKELPKLVTAIIKGAEKLTSSFLNKLPDLVAALIAEVPKLITSIMEKFIPALLDAVPKVLEKLLQGIPAIIKAVIAGIPKIITALMKAVAGIITVLAKELPKIITSLITTIGKAVPDIIKAFIDGLPAIFQAIHKAVPDFMNGLIKGIPQFIDALIDNIPKLIEEFINSIPEIVDAFIENIKGAAPTTIRDVYDPFDFFHGGGTVGESRTVPTAVFAGAAVAHGGLRTDEVPIIAQRGERVLNREETRQYEGGGSPGSQRPLYITLELDGRVLDKFVYTETRMGRMQVHRRGIVDR
ncbi:phage tail tape measure protein [Candidatus Pacearchaeota archaeon]|nr:phage tail tape measure protein [Candidatus Pacearchaeota archaeon]